MLKNQLITFWRNLRRAPFHTGITIGGLTIGFTALLCIVTFIANELSFDRWHSKQERIFRVIQEGKGEHSASLPFQAGPSFQNDLPDAVESYTRLFNFQAPSISVTYDNQSGPKTFNETRFFYADSTFFQIFSFVFLKGDWKFRRN